VALEVAFYCGGEPAKASTDDDYFDACFGLCLSWDILGFDGHGRWRSVWREVVGIFEYLGTSAESRHLDGSITAADG